MAQVNTGVVAVTNGSAVVTGTSTTWVTSLVQAGYAFTIANSGVTYDVASVDSETQITLSAPYAGATDTGLSYVICMDYTSPDGIPEIRKGDVETATIWTRAVRKIQDLITTVKNLVPAVGSITKDMTGFPDRTTTTLSWVDGTRTLSLTPVGTATVYYRGTALTFNTVKTIQIANTNGTHYIALNPTTLVLEDVGSTPSITEQILVATIFWSVTDAKAIIIGDERHSSSRDTGWHYAHHREVGAVTRSGGALTYTLENPAALSIGIATPLIVADEDLEHTINHSATPSADFEQILTSPASLPTLYYSGSAYRTTTTSTTPWLMGTSRAQYNPITAGVGSLADATNQTYVNYWIVVTNDVRYPVKAIVGRVCHASLSDAQGEEFQSYGLPFSEIAALHQIVFYVDDLLAGTLHAQIAGVYVPTKTFSGGSQVISATDHGSLGGRGDPDQHPASSITNTPAGNISATSVQAAINELDAEKQPIDSTLTSISALGTAADKYLYTTGVDTWVEGTITSSGRAILDDANADAQLTTLGGGTSGISVFKSGTVSAILSLLGLSNSTFRSLISGYIWSNNGTDANNYIDIAAGVCMDSTNTSLLVGSAMTKKLNLSWTAGTNQGGLDTGVKAVSTEYYIHAILKDSDNSVDYLFSISRTSPTMPAGYTKFRNIGWIKTDGSGNILAFSALEMGGGGVEYIWSAIVQDGGTSIGTTAALISVSVPTGYSILTSARLQTTNTNTGAIIVTSPYSADISPSTTYNGGPTDNTTSVQQRTQFRRLTNTSAQLRIRSSAAAQAYALYTDSFYWGRR